MIESIQWLGQASVRLQGPPLIHINPWRVARGAFLADVILVSQQDYTHCSPADVRKLHGPNTVIIANEAAKDLLPDDRVQVLRPWQSVCVDRARIAAIPAYNPRKEDAASAPGLGFLISMDFYDIYYAGETGLIPEMERLRPDVAMLPLGLPDVMSEAEAVEAVRMLRPRWVLPIHWSVGGGVRDLDIRSFASALGDLATVISPALTR